MHFSAVEIRFIVTTQLNSTFTNDLKKYFFRKIFIVTDYAALICFSVQLTLLIYNVEKAVMCATVHGYVLNFHIVQYHLFNQRILRRDCADAQARLNLRWTPEIWYIDTR